MPHSSATTAEIQERYDAVMQELDELAEVWVEFRAAGRDTTQVARAIDQATRESRGLERKLRREL